jgi:hypothetical protein
MEEMSTQVSPSSPLSDTIISLKEEYETKSGINNLQNKCELCGKILSNKKNLKKHLKLHSNVRNYICKICNKSYKRSDHLRRHMITHDPEPNYYECEYCLKRFCLNYHLTSHLQNVHGKAKIKVYKCPDCDLCFNKKSKLFLHQKNFHNAVFDKIPCYYPYCNKSYISEQKLNDHIQKFHMNIINNPNNIKDEHIFFNNSNSNNNNNNDNCSELNDDYKEMESENSGTNKEKKYFKCPYNNCLKVYSSQYNLSVHIKTFHLKIKSYLCPICPNKYFHKVSLKKHLMIEHKCNIEQLKKYLDERNQNNNNIKEEIIQEVKKNLEYEGLYPNSASEGQNSETNEDINNSRKISESSSYEKKNNNYFMDEFNKNMINEMKIFEKSCEPEVAN